MTRVPDLSSSQATTAVQQPSQKKETNSSWSTITKVVLPIFGALASAAAVAYGSFVCVAVFPAASVVGIVAAAVGAIGFAVFMALLLCKGKPQTQQQQQTEQPNPTPVSTGTTAPAPAPTVTTTTAPAPVVTAPAVKITAPTPAPAATVTTTTAPAPTPVVVAPSAANAEFVKRCTELEAKIRANTNWQEKTREEIFDEIQALLSQAGQDVNLPQAQAILQLKAKIEAFMKADELKNKYLADIQNQIEADGQSQIDQSQQEQSWNQLGQMLTDLIDSIKKTDEFEFQSAKEHAEAAEGLATFEQALKVYEEAKKLLNRAPQENASEETKKKFAAEIDAVLNIEPNPKDPELFDLILDPLREKRPAVDEEDEDKENDPPVAAAIASPPSPTGSDASAGSASSAVLVSSNPEADDAPPAPPAPDAPEAPAAPEAPSSMSSTASSIAAAIAHAKQSGKSQEALKKAQGGNMMDELRNRIAKNRRHVREHSTSVSAVGAPSYRQRTLKKGQVAAAVAAQSKENSGQ